MTPTLLRLFKKYGRQEDVEDPIIIAKYFHPFSHRTWYATEYDEANEEFFGYVAGDYGERWYFSKKELEQLRFAWLCVERDKYREPIPFSKLKAL